MTTNDLLSAISAAHRELGRESACSAPRGIAIAASVYGRIQSVGASPSVWHDCRCVIDPVFDNSACNVHKGQHKSATLCRKQP